MRKKQGLIFVLSGPSGSGKTTLLRSLLADSALKRKLARPVTFTTRPKRSQELNGRDYSFVSTAIFRELRRRKKLLEWTKYLGYYYATPKDFIQKRIAGGKHILLCVDLKGALRMRQIYPRNSALIFILSPSTAELRRRITQRCRKTTAQEIKRRLEQAEKEVLAAPKFDYCLVNQDLTQVVRELKNIILQKLAQR